LWFFVDLVDLKLEMQRHNEHNEAITLTTWAPKGVVTVVILRALGDLKLEM